MKLLMVVLGFCFVLIPGVWARSDVDLDLRAACGELIDIIDRQEQKRFLAMQTTSVSEALRAGYCLGVVREYLRTNRTCGFGRIRVDNWFDVAQRIAKISGARLLTAEEEVLREASCGR